MSSDHTVWQIQYGVITYITDSLSKIHFYLFYVPNKAFLSMLESRHSGNKVPNYVLQAH